MTRRAPIFVPPTLIDRLVGVFSPAAQFQRQLARTRIEWAGGGYKGGRRDRRATRNWRPRETSANQDIIDDLPDLRSRSRDLVRNDALAGGAVATVVTNVVGTGLVLQSQVDRETLGITEDQADRLQKALEREFTLATRSLDFAGRRTWGDLQDLMLRGALESGDIFAVRRWRRRPGEVYGLKLQLIEADRCRNQTAKRVSERMVDGVEHDVDGMPIAFHFASSHRDDYAAKGTTWTRVDARDAAGSPMVLHLMAQTRPNQTRGVPYLAPVVEKLKELSDYAEAEIAAAVVSAFFTAFVTPGTPETGDAPLLEASTGSTSASQAGDEMALGRGAVVELSPGDDVEFANPSRPNQNFEPFFVAVVRQIGMALELPFEVLIKHFEASYSASRAALEMAWQFFRKRRKWLADYACQPIYEWVITEAVASGRIDAPGFLVDPAMRQAYLRAEWIGPARIQLDPYKEASADKLDLEMRVKTRAQITMERTGGQWDRKHEQLVREQRRAEDDGIASATAPGGQQDAAAADNSPAGDQRRTRK